MGQQVEVEAPLCAMDCQLSTDGLTNSSIHIWLT